jgi:hypothetical protein
MVSSQIASLFLLLFVCICFLVFTFGFPCICFGFRLLQLYFSILCFPVVSLCVFWFVCSFTDLLCACFATLRSLSVPFFAPHHDELPMLPSLSGFDLHAIGFIFLYFYYFFACNKSCLNRLAFGCDAWSRSLGCRCEHFIDFRVEEDKCWPRVLSPQCQGISVGLGFSALNAKE